MGWPKKNLTSFMKPPLVQGPKTVIWHKFFSLISDDLTIDYQFTFNLSKAEDRHLRGINFRNIPTKRDVDVDFSITCSVPAKVNKHSVEI